MRIQDTKNKNPQIAKYVTRCFQRGTSKQVTIAIGTRMNVQAMEAMKQYSVTVA